MSPIFVLALLSLLSSAIPILPRQSNSTNPFVLQAFQSDAPIHLSSLNANDGHFWLGKATSSSCPSSRHAELELKCPTGTETAVVVSGDGYASLYVNVPAGQNLYVAKDGALSFAEAHDEDITSIAYPSGFSLDKGTGAGSALGSFTFSGTSSKGWLACPVAENGPWQVYAHIKQANVTGCLKFEAVGETYEGSGVWRYD